MLIRFRDLVTLNLVATDGTKHRVRDIFVNGDLRVTHVAADLGGWFSDRHGVIGIGRFGQPDIASTTWPCELDEDALQDRADRDPAERAASLAPAGTEAGPHHAGQPGALVSMRDWTAGTDVDASDGHVGKLMCAIFDSADWHARYLVVETANGGLPQNQRVFEKGLMASGPGEERVRLTCSRAEAENALDLHDVDDVEGKWYNKVMAYYGLQS